jgi:hypothetical protein
MRRVTRDSLRRMVEELPSVDWPDRELEGLVAPQFGVITGFPEFLAEIDAVCHIDLGTIGLPGALSCKPKSGG